MPVQSQQSDNHSLKKDLKTWTIVIWHLERPFPLEAEALRTCSISSTFNYLLSASDVLFRFTVEVWDHTHQCCHSCFLLGAVDAVGHSWLIHYCHIPTSYCSCTRAGSRVKTVQPSTLPLKIQNGRSAYLCHRHGSQAAEPVGPRRRPGTVPQGSEAPGSGLWSITSQEPAEWEAFWGQPVPVRHVISGIQRAWTEVFENPRSSLDEANGKK